MMGPASDSTAIRMMDIEVPKQYMIIRNVENCIKSMEKNFMRVKYECFNWA
jgi:hypothetical protein